MKFKLNSEVKRLLAYYGNRYKLAKALKITACAVYKWERFPELQAYKIEKLTKGKFSAEKLMKS